MPTISIIVPVYKTEKYLQRCVDSILMQKFTDFECILIDDGSPDNCPVICDEYAEKDNRIKVIHQENRGVSAARNAGLDIAKGEWIGFVDSDDWCDSGMYEFLLNNAIKYQADVSICGYSVVTEKNETKFALKNCHNLVMNSRDAKIKMLSSGYFGPYTVNKLINNQLLSNKNEIVRFDETIKHGEDRLFIFCLLSRSRRIIYSSQSCYYYCYRSDAVTKIHEREGLTDISVTRFDADKKLLQMETDNKVRCRILAKEGAFAVNSCLSYLRKSRFRKDENYYFLQKIVKNNFMSILMFGLFKHKLRSCLVLFPSMYRLYRKIRWRE